MRPALFHAAVAVRRDALRWGVPFLPAIPFDHLVPDPDQDHATELLLASSRGDQRSMHELAGLAYDDLRAQARRFLADNAAVALDATALVHDTFLRLVDQRNTDWRNAAHFAAIASTVLRRVLIDELRARGRQRDRSTRISSAGEELIAGQITTNLLDLDEALTEFATLDPDAARIVELRFFSGLTIREIAAETGLARSTVQDSWSFARAWLGRRLGGGKTQ